MANETIITVIGNLTGDPELRFTPSGKPVCNFTVACTPRTFDRRTNEWVDGETAFWRCSIWNQPAENVAESLHKGMQVIVEGRIKPNTYEKDGVKRTSMDIDVNACGPTLAFQTAQVTKNQRQQVQTGQGFGQGGPQQGQGWQNQGQQPQWSQGPDPQGGWAQQGPPQQGPPQGQPQQQPMPGWAPQQGQQGRPGASYDEPPF